MKCCTRSRKLEMVADAKRRRSSFTMYVKESLSVNSSILIQCPLFTPRFAMPDFYPTWLWINVLHIFTTGHMWYEHHKHTNLTTTLPSMNILHATINYPCKQVFSKIAQVIYCLPRGFWLSCIIFVILLLDFL